LESARRLFCSEAETLEKLANSQAVSLEKNQEFYLVQFHSRSSAQSLNYNQASAGLKNLSQLLQEVLNILIFVHSQVIHRDIKPSNLIRRQQDSKLVLVDFGSVKQAWTQVVTAQGKTSTTFAIGIPATGLVMPIEQERETDRPNSDIYALV